MRGEDRERIKHSAAADHMEGQPLGPQTIEECQAEQINRVFSDLFSGI